jgi:hypothetical protein
MDIGQWMKRRTLGNGARTTEEAKKKFHKPMILLNLVHSNNMKSQRQCNEEYNKNWN